VYITVYTSTGVRTVSVCVCVCCIQSEVTQWRLLFIFTASAHLISAVCFVLLWVSRHQPNSIHLTGHLHSTSPAPPTDHEVPPTAKPVVHHTSSGRGGEDDNRSAVDSDTEYGSVDESIEPATVTSPTSRSLNTERELQLGQLMESIL